MKYNFNTQLVKDMALKTMEDAMELFERQHKLIHGGGGSCADAAAAKLVAVSTMYRLLTETLPADVGVVTAPIIDELVAHVRDKAEEERQVLEVVSNEDIDEIIKQLVSKLFGVPLEEVEVQEVTHKISEPAPTKH